MGKKRSRAKLYRCRVNASIRMDKEERSIRLGPGSMIDEDLYSELIQKKLIPTPGERDEPDWFEEVDDDGAALPPSDESETEL